jgi:hypothetical protein
VMPREASLAGIGSDIFTICFMTWLQSAKNHTSLSSYRITQPISARVTNPSRDKRSMK